MRSSFTTIDDLAAEDRQAMRALLERHFSGVEPETFADDLAEKTHVVRLFEDDGRLAGFTTIEYQRLLLGGAEMAVVYSGDTIVDPSAWSAASLGAAWIASVFDLHHATGPVMPLWWLLLTSGLRTHRYLSVCSMRYHPAPEGRDDPEAALLLPKLSSRRFGARYDPCSGIVRLLHPQSLRAHLIDPPPHVAADPQARLFLERNPGHAHGDELVSLCRLDESNFTRAGLRALMAGRRAAAESCR